MFSWCFVVPTWRCTGTSLHTGVWRAVPDYSWSSALNTGCAAPSWSSAAVRGKPLHQERKRNGKESSFRYVIYIKSENKLCLRKLFSITACTTSSSVLQNKNSCTDLQKPVNELGRRWLREVMMDILKLKDLLHQKDLTSQAITYTNDSLQISFVQSFSWWGLC